MKHGYINDFNKYKLICIGIILIIYCIGAIFQNWNNNFLMQCMLSYQVANKLKNKHLKLNLKHVKAHYKTFPFQV